jgi:hypothetical protein
MLENVENILQVNFFHLWWPFTVYLKNYKWELSKDTFLMQFFSQLYT